jgi:hypothetical protein
MCSSYSSLRERENDRRKRLQYLRLADSLSREREEREIHIFLTALRPMHALSREERVREERRKVGMYKSCAILLMRTK